MYDNQQVKITVEIDGERVILVALVAPGESVRYSAERMLDGMLETLEGNQRQWHPTPEGKKALEELDITRYESDFGAAEIAAAQNPFLGARPGPVDQEAALLSRIKARGDDAENPYYRTHITDESKRVEAALQAQIQGHVDGLRAKSKEIQAEADRRWEKIQKLRRLDESDFKIPTNWTYMPALDPDAMERTRAAFEAPRKLTHKERVALTEEERATRDAYFSHHRAEHCCDDKECFAPGTLYEDGEWKCATHEEEARKAAEAVEAFLQEGPVGSQGPVCPRCACAECRGSMGFGCVNV